MEKLKKLICFCDIILKYSTNFNQYIRKKDPQNAFFSKYVQIMFNNTKNRYLFKMLKQSTPNHLLTQRVRQTSITLFHKFSHVLLPFPRSPPFNKSMLCRKTERKNEYGENCERARKILSFLHLQKKKKGNENEARHVLTYVKHFVVKMMQNVSYINYFEIPHKILRNCVLVI